MPRIRRRGEMVSHVMPLDVPCVPGIDLRQERIEQEGSGYYGHHDCCRSCQQSNAALPSKDWPWHQPNHACHGTTRHKVRRSIICISLPIRSEIHHIHSPGSGFRKPFGSFQVAGAGSGSVVLASLSPWALGALGSSCVAGGFGAVRVQ